MPNYNREAAVAYAKEWAQSRNPAYYDFSAIGGDCTNFVSQCLYAGGCAMDFTPLYGWYYRNANDRTPSWTGVQYLANFLLRPNPVGAYGELCALDELQPGDIVQLGDGNGNFYHTPLVCAIEDGEILVAAHSFDRWMYPLSSYAAPIYRPIRVYAAKD